MSDLNQPAPASLPDRGPSPGAMGCVAGAALTFWGGLVVLAVASVAAFLFLPRLLQGPLELEGGRLDAVQLQPLVHADAPITDEDLRGKVVVLSFWGTWCPPCLMDLPHIVDLWQKFRERDDFLLLAVSCGRGGREDIEELRADTAALFANQRIDMPAYADTAFVTRGSFEKVQALRGYPTTLVIDRRGRIRKVWVGFDPKMPGQLERLVEELLTAPESRREEHE